MFRKIFSIFLILAVLLVAILFTNPGNKASAALPAAGGTATPTALPKPDLVILSVVPHQTVLDASGCALSRINSLDVTVQNAGAAAAGVFEVSATGRTKMYQAVPSLAAGASITLTYTDLPTDGVNLITVDSTGLVAESNEGNNTLTFNSPTPPAQCTATPTPIGFKSPTPTSTGTQPCTVSGSVSYDHLGGAGLVNVPIVEAFTTGTPGPRVVSTTGPYGQYNVHCLTSPIYANAVSAQSIGGLNFVPTAVMGSSSYSPYGYIVGIPTYTSTPVATPSCDTPIFTGRVTDSATGLGIGGATVTANLDVPRVFSTTTDSAGGYSLSVPTGYGCHTTSLSAAAAGYTTLTNPVSFVNTVINFSLTGAVTITPTSGVLPDLTVLSITEFSYTAPTATPNTQGCWPSGPYNFLGLRVAIQNIGTGSAGSFVVDLNGARQTVSSLAAGQTLNVDFTGISLTRSRIATVDATGLIAESNETNNTFTLTLSAATATRTGTVPPQICITATTGPSLTPTRTPTRTNTPTTGPSLTPTRTPTITPTVGGGCTPVTTIITAPFTYDGAGTFCWQSSNLGTYINIWNTTSVTINGVNITNLYTPSSSYPAKINGFWYVAYNSASAFGHLEAK